MINGTYNVVLVITVKNMKCTGLKAVSYPDTRKLIKGNTVQTRTIGVE